MGGMWLRGWDPQRLCGWVRRFDAEARCIEQVRFRCTNSKAQMEKARNFLRALHILWLPELGSNQRPAD